MRTYETHFCQGIRVIPESLIAVSIKGFKAFKALATDTDLYVLDSREKSNDGFPTRAFTDSWNRYTQEIIHGGNSSSGRVFIP